MGTDDIKLVLTIIANQASTLAVTLDYHAMNSSPSTAVIALNDLDPAGFKFSDMLRFVSKLFVQVFFVAVKLGLNTMQRSFPGGKHRLPLLAQQLLQLVPRKQLHPSSLGELRRLIYFVGRGVKMNQPISQLSQIIEGGIGIRGERTSDYVLEKLAGFIERDRDEIPILKAVNLRILRDYERPMLF